MKPLHLGAAILAGSAATVAMTVLMYAAPLMGLPPMDLLGTLGGLFPGVSPYLAGGLIHLGIGVALALLYTAIFARRLPGPGWIRGATFSLLPWLFAITLMGPAMAWVEAAVAPPVTAHQAVNPCGAARPANPCAARPPIQAANPCGIQPKAASPCGGTTLRPANPCGAGTSGAQAPSPWLLRMMSLIAHLAYGVVLGSLYRRHA